MNKLIIRSACLVLVIILAIVAAAVPDSQLALASDHSKYPAVVKIAAPDGTTEQVTYARTLIEAIDEAGIAVGESDLLSLPDNTVLQPGQTYEVLLTRPGQVTLNWSGFAVATSGDFSSMSDLLSRAGFSNLDLSGGSRIENNLAANVDSAAIALTFVNVDKKIVRIYETIPFSSITVDDPTLYIGQTAVAVEGQEGQRALVYEETYEDGILIGTVQTGIEIVKEPIQNVINKGTRERIVYSSIKANLGSVEANFNKIRKLLKPNGTLNYGSFHDNGDSTITVDGRTFSYTAMKKRTITMYDGLDCCMQAGCHLPPVNHNTYSGISAQRGLVATFGIRSNGKFVSTLLPMGTILFIEGYGLGVVADIHGVSNNPDLIDACYDAGDIRAGIANLGMINSRVYILEVP